jgi:septum formation protein
LKTDMSLWLRSDPLVLASKSAVRRAMLEAAGIPVEVRPADIDERGIEAASGSAEASEVASLLAREKAKAASVQLPGRLVVGADQTLALGHERFSKPRDRDEARAQLRSLRGRSHKLSAAVAVCRDNSVVYEEVSDAKLKMRAFSDRVLEAYLEAAGPAVTDSVGGYQLERIGIQLFEAIEGDHFTILGLPLLPLLGFLRREGSLA